MHRSKRERIAKETAAPKLTPKRHVSVKPEDNAQPELPLAEEPVEMQPKAEVPEGSNTVEKLAKKGKK